MFETYYGFERTPFIRSIDTDGLFLSQKTDEMLARFQIAASRRQFTDISSRLSLVIMSRQKQ